MTKLLLLSPSTGQGMVKCEPKPSTVEDEKIKDDKRGMTFKKERWS